MLLNEGFEGRRKLTCRGNVEDEDLLANRARGILDFSQVGAVVGSSRAHEHGDQVVPRNQLAGHLESFRQQRSAEQCHPCCIAARPIKAGD